MIYDKNLILPYYKIERTEEGKQFFYAHRGYFNFWDEYLILHTKESEGKMFCCIVNRPNTKFSGGKLTKKQKISFSTSINNSVYYGEPEEMFEDFPELRTSKIKR